MAKQVLPTNFMDDILNESMNGKRRWIITQNDDGTYTLEDATTYDQLGNTFGQAQVNEMNKAINESVDQARVIDDYKTLAAVNQNGFVPGAKPVAQLISDLSAVPEFVIDKSTGKITGYKTKAGADTVFPFSAPLLNMKFSQMPKVNYYTSTNLVFENPGYNRLKVTDCNANYWWVYNSPNFDVNNWGNELDTKYQIGNRNDTVFDITNVKYVLIHTKQSENNNSGFGGCKFNLCNE